MTEATSVVTELGLWVIVYFDEMKNSSNTKVSVTETFAIFAKDDRRSTNTSTTDYDQDAFWEIQGQVFISITCNLSRVVWAQRFSPRKIGHVVVYHVYHQNEWIGRIASTTHQKRQEMKSASIQELKKELQQLDKEKLVQSCLRLAKFKKENKELLTYLLFESDDEAAYVASVKNEIQSMFSSIPAEHNLYFKHKMARKILRTTNRFIKYSDGETTKPELLIHYCKMLNEYIPERADRLALDNLYTSTIDKIRKAISALHEDLQYDYLMELDGIC